MSQLHHGRIPVEFGVQGAVGLAAQNGVLRLRRHRKTDVEIEENEQRHIKPHGGEGGVFLAFHNGLRGSDDAALQTHGHTVIGVGHPLANAEGLEEAEPAGVAREAGEEGKLEEGEKSHVDEEEEHESGEDATLGAGGGGVEKEEGEGEVAEGEERGRGEGDEEEKDDEELVEQEDARIADLQERKRKTATAFQNESSFSTFASSSTTSLASCVALSAVTRMEKQKKHRMSRYR